MDPVAYLRNLLTDSPSREEWKPGNCVSDALYGAKRFVEEHNVPVRMAVSKLSTEPDVDHVQIQALLNGNWTWLTVDHEGPYKGVPRVWKKHFEAEPYRYVSLEDFAKEQAGIEHVVPESLKDKTYE